MFLVLTKTSRATGCLNFEVYWINDINWLENEMKYQRKKKIIL